MPEHVHLLVTEPKTNSLATSLQALKISVAMRLPQKPFWLRRYHDFNIFSHEKRVEKLKYIHRNPVRRGLVANPADWPWSSFCHYASGLVGTVEIESDRTVAQHAGLVLLEASPAPTSIGIQRR
jgi:putative transposase